MSKPSNKELEKIQEALAVYGSNREHLLFDLENGKYGEDGLVRTAKQSKQYVKDFEEILDISVKAITILIQDSYDKGWNSRNNIASEETIAKAVRVARIQENQMGLDFHIAIRNGLEQESENAQQTATWKANETIIREFEIRIKQLEELQ